jgi:hypothetical protein
VVLDDSRCCQIGPPASAWQSTLVQVEAIVLGHIQTALQHGTKSVELLRYAPVALELMYLGSRCDVCMQEDFVVLCSSCSLQLTINGRWHV